MVRTHALVIARRQGQTLTGDAGPVTGGGGLMVSKMGTLQDKGRLGKLGKFHVQVCSSNVHASDCGSVHCNGCMSMAFLLGQHVE